MTEKDEIWTGWKEHFKIMKHFLTTNVKANVEEKEDDMTKKELGKVRNNIKNSKASGHARIISEMIRCLETQRRNFLLKIINLAWNNEYLKSRKRQYYYQYRHKDKFPQDATAITNKSLTSVIDNF